jgi:hypothetical protein
MKGDIMAKRVWVSLPLTTTDLTDSGVVGFLKGGKRKLEIETGAFITKWLADRSVPFTIDYASSTLDQSIVMAALPASIQRASENSVAAPSVPQTEPPTSVETSADEPPKRVELPAVASRAAEPTAEPGPVEVPVGERATKAETAPVSDSTAGPTTLTDPAVAETPAAEPPEMVGPPAPTLTGELTVPEEPYARSKRIGRPRAKSPKAGPSEAA